MNASPLIEYLWRQARLSRKAIRYVAAQVNSWNSLQQALTQAPKKYLQKIPKAIFRGQVSETLVPFSASKPSQAYLSYLDQDYPSQLHQLYDPPCILYYLGRVDLLHTMQPKIVIVGTRRPTDYAREITKTLIQTMAPAHPLIISGMALGIDSIAHQSALECRLSTLAVLGTPLQAQYFGHRRMLFQQIAQYGLLMTELDPRAALGPWRFPERNRVLAALGDAIVVVEAPAKSGALITAQEALELGKEIFVVPGPLHPNRNQGGHRLIQQGAHLLTDVKEIFDVLGLSFQSTASVPTVAKEALEPAEKKILKIFHSRQDSLHIDKIIALSQNPAPQVIAQLMMLILKGWVEEKPGGYYKRLA